jgi:hypothetical protein
MKHALHLSRVANRSGRRLVIKYLLFGVLLSPVGQWDTDHGCKYLLFGVLLSPVGQWDTDHGCKLYALTANNELFVYEVEE